MEMGTRMGMGIEMAMEMEMGMGKRKVGMVSYLELLMLSSLMAMLCSWSHML